MTNAEKIKLRASGKKSPFPGSMEDKVRRIKLLRGKPFPKIKTITGITIHNMTIDKPYREYDVKCDRSSPLGSPFYLQGDESRRDWVCVSYQKWFDENVLTRIVPGAWEELERLMRLYKIHNRLRIFCWCAPKLCHTQTIKSWLMENK